MVRCAQPMPALLTTARSGAISAAALTAAVIWSVSVTSTWANTPPISGGERLALVGLQVGDHDDRALGGELPGARPRRCPRRRR